MPRQPPFHVWVDMTGKWSSPAPGVLLAWRHTDRRGWEAWVARVECYSTGTGSEVLMSQSWIPANLVRPADAAASSRRAPSTPPQTGELHDRERCGEGVQ